MTAISLNSFVGLPLSVALFEELSKRSPGKVSSLAEDVLWDFLERTEGDVVKPDYSNGIRWGTLVLPENTEIRTKYYDEYKTATVQAGKVVWGGRSFTSVSRLASAMRGNTSNNAWRVLEVKRPNESDWHLADLLRR